MDSQLARKMWRTLEPFHGLIYLAPADGCEELRNLVRPLSKAVAASGGLPGAARE